MKSSFNVPMVLSLLVVVTVPGCSWFSPAQPNVPQAQMPADAVQLAAPGLTGGGAVVINIQSFDGQGRAVQFLPRATRFDDIKSFKFDLLDATTNAQKYSVTTNTIKTTGYTITNLPAPDNLKIRVTAYSATNASGTVLNNGGTAALSAAVSVVDQAVAATTIALNLADGFDPNGDISATVNVTNGATQSLPTVSID